MSTTVKLCGECDKNLDLQIDFAIGDTRDTLCDCTKHRSCAYCLRSCSTHGARRRALRAFYVNLLNK